jgi:hypothetical protein
MQEKLIQSIQSHKSIQPMIQRVSDTKSWFEHNYYAVFHFYDKHTKSNINYFFTFTTAFLLGCLLNAILTTWKPMYQWSVIEFVGIGYFSFNRGYWLCENTHVYLKKVSSVPPSIPREGDSYFNPIDLTTMDMAEEREALEALRMLSEEKNASFDKQIKTE